LALGLGWGGGFGVLVALGFDGGLDVYPLQRAGGDHFGGEVADGPRHGFQPGDGFVLVAGNVVLYIWAEVGLFCWGFGLLGRGFGLAAAAEQAGFDTR
jgi:hypothetical protein